MIGVSVEDAPDIYHRTRIVTFTPYLLIVNNLPLPIRIAQRSERRHKQAKTPKGIQSSPQSHDIVLAGDVVTFNWPRARDNKMLSFRVCVCVCIIVLLFVIVL